jgi:hypothetical protein
MSINFDDSDGCDRESGVGTIQNVDAGYHPVYDKSRVRLRFLFPRNAVTANVGSIEPAI